MRRPTPQQAQRPGARRTDVLASAALLVVVIALFGRALAFPFLDWDDVTFIVTNPSVTDPSSVAVADLFFTPHLGYIVPVTTLTWSALYQLGGGSPWPFHLANLLLHGGCAMLVFLLARRLRLELMPALTAGLLFTVHPLVAEPVAWATGLKDLLSCCLTLAATLTLLPVLRNEVCRRPATVAATALALGTLAMLAKPTVLLIGALWLLVAISSSWTPRPSRRMYVTPLVATLLGALLALLNYLVRREMHIDDLTGTAGGNPLLALGYQIQHLAWPTQLHPLYYLDRMAGWGDPHTWLGLVAALGTIAVLIAFRRHAPVVLGIGLAVAAYLPTSNIIPFNRFISDSYLYLPLAGISLAAAQGVQWIANGTGEPLRRPLWRPAVTLVVLGLVLGVAATRTWHQVDRWRSHRMLWEPVALDYPRWQVPYLLLAQGLRFEGRTDEALQAYRRALDVRYEDRALEGVAATLMEAGRLGAAECVLVEQLLLGKSKQRAAHNLALLLATHDSFRPRYPAVAATAVQRTRQALAEGAYRWPAEWVGNLTRRRARLATNHPAPRSWRKRQCPSLQGKTQGRAPQSHQE